MSKKLVAGLVLAGTLLYVLIQQTQPRQRTVPNPPTPPVLYGTVYNMKTLAPLDEVNVDVDGARTVTNEHGIYALQVSAGPCQVIFTKDGFESVTRNSFITAGENELNINLAPRE